MPECSKLSDSDLKLSKTGLERCDWGLLVAHDTAARLYLVPVVKNGCGVGVASHLRGDWRFFVADDLQR